MKNHYFILVSLFCFICTISCDRSYDPEPYCNTVRVIQLVKPEYKQYVIATLGYNSNTVSLGGNANVLKDGALPYWDLTDDYLLIDWRWYRFPITNNKQYLLLYPWSVVENSYYPIWNLDTCQYIEDPIKVSYGIDMAKVNAQLETQELYQLAYEDIHREHEGDEEFRKKTAYMDSVWTYTQQQLITIIEQDRLKEVLITNKFALY